MYTARRSTCNNLTPRQKDQVLASKQRNGWIDSCTPPPGFHILSRTTGKAEPNNQVVSTIRAAATTMIQEGLSYIDNDMNSKPPPLTTIQPNKRAVSDTTSTHAWVSFGR